MRLSGKIIPALLGLFLLVGLVITLLLAKQGNIFNIGASPSENPQDLRITNISDNSFTVTYTTSAGVLGTLNYSTSSVKLDNVALDDRDQLNQTVNKYTVHSITVRGIEANTAYFFQINSGDKKFINGDSPFSVKTGKTISSEPPTQTPVSGKVLAEDGKSPTEALVYLKINGAQDISALTKQDGSYIIPLNSLRTQTLDDYYSLPPESILSIEAVTNASSAKASADLSGISPVPPITLSQTYDFSTSQVSANVNNPSQGSFPDLDKKVSKAPTLEPTAAALQTLTATPTISPAPSIGPTESVIAENISPAPSEEIQPTLPPTGNSSAIIIPVLGSFLAALGFLIFTKSGRSPL